MQPAPVPDNESLRLAVLDSFDLFYTPAEECFDRLTRVAAQALSMPIAMVTLVGRERQWFKSRVGVGWSEMPRAQSICAHTILQDGPLVVADARQDPRFRQHPLVRAAPGIRFYAGVPLRLAFGFKVGTLCVMDTRPRELDDDQLAMLHDLARAVEDALQQDRQAMTRASEQGLLACQERRTLLDAVSGCWNRAGFEALLQSEAGHARQHASPFALLILTMEDAPADEPALMVEAASRLRRVTQSAGIVTRFSPESFALVIAPCDRAALSRIQRRVRLVMQERPFGRGAGRPLAVNCGGALVAPPGFDVALALVDADRRLQQARRRARL
ncbi:MAG: GAF domain-containing protein [Paludibacterium sp.]|uniref:GGDEF domain-containing protein n=1 Tax=Paludibacterium sp. TaxID=1917523 RepID=UPI002600BBE3|nr:GAF domain-containing protein [Paludibacterium sp.]MBV8047050.1 GAF domain-containing protein [Paludibacterium sp.]MBV8646408.1 GAF domain-containing protein [Paludibacterium sp.]